MSFLDKFNEKILIPILIVMVFLSPRFGNLRIQDFILVLICIIALMTKLCKVNQRSNNIFLNREIWEIKKLKYVSLYIFLINNLILVLKEIIIINPYFFYYLKEVQFFILFSVIIYHYDGVENYFKIFMLSLFSQVIFGIYQVISGNHYGYYGIGLLGETGPSQSGALYMFSYILFLSRIYYFINFKLHHKYFFKFMIYIFMSAVSMVLILMTVSRITIVVSVTLTLIVVFKILYHSRYRIVTSWYVVLLLILLFFAIVSIMSTSSNDNVIYILKRIEQIPDGIVIRLNKWKRDFEMIFNNPLQLIFGRGSGIHNILSNSTTLGVDSNYFRIIYEQGIMGLLLFIAFIYKFYKYINTHCEMYYRISWSLMLVGMLLMSITHEVFYVVKISEVFWVYTAIVVGKSLTNVESKIYY